MDSNLLSNLLSLQFNLFHIPFYLYDRNKQLSKFEPHPLSCDLVLPWLSKFSESDYSPVYILIKDLVLLGRVYDKASGLQIIIGPTRIGNITENSLHSFVYSYSPYVSITDMQDVGKFLNSCPLLYLEQFLSILSSIHGFLNNEFLSTKDIINKSENTIYEEDAQLRMIQATIEHTYEETNRRNNFGIEAEIMFYITNGMSNKLKKMQLNHHEIGNLSSDSLRHYKNALLILNTLSQRAAILGGLDAEISYQLGEIYIQKIEACRDLNSLLQINFNQNMTLDYCQRVELIIYPKTKHLKINKAMHYVRENYQKRLTVDEIATVVGLSPEYLSSKFHQVTGTTLPNYINQHKITEAKELLHFTDMSLLEISEYLSYSSQSYFQTMFKKTTGKTPKEYRITKKIFT